MEARFESYAVENICQSLPKWRPSFYRSRSGAELDLVLERAGQALAIEVKASTAPRPSRGFWQAAEDVRAGKKHIIAPVEEAYPIQNGAIAAPPAAFLRKFSDE